MSCFSYVRCYISHWFVYFSLIIIVYCRICWCVTNRARSVWLFISQIITFTLHIRLFSVLNGDSWGLAPQSQQLAWSNCVQNSTGTLVQLTIHIKNGRANENWTHVSGLTDQCNNHYTIALLKLDLPTGFAPATALFKRQVLYYLSYGRNWYSRYDLHAQPIANRATALLIELLEHLNWHRWPDSNRHALASFWLKVRWSAPIPQQRRLKLVARAGNAPAYIASKASALLLC